MMNKALKISLAIAVLCAAVVVVLYLRSATKRPTCDCFYPNAGVYGVKTNGKCVETDCEPPKSQGNSKQP